MRNFELPTTYENETFLSNLVKIEDWKVKDQVIFLLLRRATRYTEHNRKYLKTFADENSLEGNILAFPIRVLTQEKKFKESICILCSCENNPIFTEIEDSNCEIPLDDSTIIEVEEYLSGDSIYIDSDNNKVGILQQVYY